MTSIGHAYICSNSTRRSACNPHLPLLLINRLTPISSNTRSKIISNIHTSGRTMAMKSGVLLLMGLFLASASLSMAYSPLEKLDECLEQCQMRRPTPEVTLSCMGRCANDFEQQQQEELDCERQCQFEPMERQRQCKWRCEQDQSFSPKQSRLERLRSCQRRCTDLGFLQQLPCQTRCATEFGFRSDNAMMNPEDIKEEEETSSSKQIGKEWDEDEEMSSRPIRPSRFPKEKQMEQCEKRCQFQPKWQQGQCFRKCEQQPLSKWDKYEQCQRRCAQMGILSQIPCHAKCTADFGLGGSSY